MPWCIRCALAVVLIALHLACGGGSAPPTPARRPDVLLLTLDTVRADTLGCYGHPWIRTPNLDGLAQEAALYENAFSPIPSTLPSHASILTGRHPLSHGIHDNGIYFLEESAVTVAETLRSSGYATGAFVSAFVLDRQFNLDQGFETYDDEVDLALRPKRSLPPNVSEGGRRWFMQVRSRFERRAETVTRRATDWLASQGDRPIFLWIHYFDAHEPYRAPEPYTTMYDPDYQGSMNGEAIHYRRLQADEDRGRHWLHMTARYAGEISYLDAWSGVLFEALRRSGRWEQALVVVVGDHGEAFGEHGRQMWEHRGSCTTTYCTCLC